MKVAILGGGPSGAMAAAQLASRGVNTVVFDEKLAWEKPCGGGLTWKAYSQYPFLFDSGTPHKVIHRTILSAPKSKPVTLNLDNPLLIYSRFDLNSLLLERAQQSGAQVEKTRVLSIDRTSSGWALRTRHGALDADYCIVATGARNPLRGVGTELTPADSMTALGYFVPGNRDHIDVQFLPGFEGYIWVFPRCGHMSVGICGKGVSASNMRIMLELYMREHGISKEGATFYGHLLPALETPSWQRNRVAGDGWLATGDAAGLVDPVTGEGLYYALRSADLASQAILTKSPEAIEIGYRNLIRADFMNDLEFGSRLAHRVFNGRFLGGSITSRMVQFTRLSPKFRELMQDLFAGTQSYIGLKKRLMKNLNGSLIEVVCNLGFGRLIPGRDVA
jgi:flavin-dependent dehydrogenase